MNELTSTTAIPATYRDINIITQEFKFLQKQAQQMALSYVVQMGRRLAEAKALLNDGKAFETWLNEEVQFKKSAAYNYIRIAEEYGADQVDLFGTTKSEAMGKLSYSQALALLAVPEDEREAFIEENHVEDMSARELKKAIAERDAAIKEKETAERALEDAKWELEEKLDDLRAELEEKPNTEELQNNLKTAIENSTRVEKELENAKNQVQKVQDEKSQAVASYESKLSAVTKQRDVLQKELTEAKKNPEIPEELLEKMEKEAAERLQAEYEEKLKAAQSGQQSAAAEVEALKKKLAQSSEEVAIFRAYLTDVTETLGKLQGILSNVKAKDPETAAKLTNATVKILSDYVGRL